MGTITNIAFLVSCFKSGTTWIQTTVIMNVVYLMLTFASMLIDVMLRFAQPGLFCKETDICQQVWKQLYYFWAAFAIGTVIWFWAIKKMAKYLIAEKVSGGDFINSDSLKFK